MLWPLRPNLSVRRGAVDRTGMDSGCDRYRSYCRGRCAPPDLQLDSRFGFRRRPFMAVRAIRMAGCDIGTSWNTDRLWRLFSFLSVRRHGWRRCEVDGG